MNNNVLLVLGGIFVFLFLWIFAIVYFLVWWSQPSADVLQAENENLYEDNNDEINNNDQDEDIDDEKENTKDENEVDGENDESKDADNNKIKKEEDNYEQKYEDSKIVVHIPDFFYERRWFEVLKRRFQREYSIKVDYEKYKDMNNYQNELLLSLAREEDWYDVFMIPSTWKKSFDQFAYNIEFDSSLDQHFHYQFSEINDIDSNTFLPFAIDPLVTFVRDNSFWSWKNSISVSDIQEYILMEGDSSWLNMPVMFWVSPGDISYMQNNNTFYENYLDVIYSYVKLSWMEDDIDYIEFLLDLWSDWNYKSWDPRKFISIVRRLSQENEKCRKFPDICVKFSSFVDISFGYMSDLDKKNKYFDDGLTDDWFEVFNFPIKSDEYLTRSWWFMINKNSNKNKQSVLFLDKFMQEVSWWNTSFWSSTISSFNSVISSQRSKNIFENIIWNLTDFNIKTWTVSKYENFIKDTKFLQALNWEYSISGFFDELDKYIY